MSPIRSVTAGEVEHGAHRIDAREQVRVAELQVGSGGEPVAEEEVVEVGVLGQPRDRGAGSRHPARVGVRAGVPPARRIGAERAHHRADDQRLAHTARPPRPPGSCRWRPAGRGSSTTGSTSRDRPRRRCPAMAPGEGGVAGGDARAAVGGDRGTPSGRRRRRTRPGSRRASRNLPASRCARRRQVDGAGDVAGDRDPAARRRRGTARARARRAARPSRGQSSTSSMCGDAVAGSRRARSCPAAAARRRCRAAVACDEPAAQPAVEHAHVRDARSASASTTRGRRRPSGRRRTRRRSRRR